MEPSLSIIETHRPVKRSNMELCKGCPAQNFSKLTGNGTMRPHCTCRAHLAAIVQRVWVGCATFVPLRLGACMRLQSIKPPPFFAQRSGKAPSHSSSSILSLLCPAPGSRERRATPIACPQLRHGAVGVGRRLRRTLHRRAHAAGLRVLPPRRRAQ